MFKRISLVAVSAVLFGSALVCEAAAPPWTTVTSTINFKKGAKLNPGTSAKKMVVPVALVVPKDTSVDGAVIALPMTLFRGHEHDVIVGPTPIDIIAGTQMGKDSLIETAIMPDPDPVDIGGAGFAPGDAPPALFIARQLNQNAQLASAQTAGVQAELNAAKAELANLKATVTAQGTTVGELKNTVVAQGATLVNHAQTINANHARLGTVETEVEGVKTKLSGLESRLSENERLIQALQTPPPSAPPAVPSGPFMTSEVVRVNGCPCNVWIVNGRRSVRYTDGSYGQLIP